MGTLTRSTTPYNYYVLCSTWRPQFIHFPLLDVNDSLISLTENYPV